MNILRVVLAALGGFGTYFAFGGLVFVLVPSLKNAFRKYPAIYRSEEGIMRVFPAGMAMMFLSIVALAILFAMLDRDGSGLAMGAKFGALIGVFVIGAFVFHNYVNLNIGLSITLLQAVAYFVEWTLTGIAIGLIYKPN